MGGMETGWHIRGGSPWRRERQEAVPPEPSGVWVALATSRQAGTHARWLMMWRQGSAVFWMLGVCVWGGGGRVA